ncbi:MAG: tyrosine-type recombinase/integrase [Thermoanaerobaculia bacterium]
MPSDDGLGDLASLIESFLARRYAERITPRQVVGNRRALALLLEAVRKRLGIAWWRPIPVTAVTTEDLLGVIAALRERGLAGGTVSAYASAFRLFFGDLSRRGLLLVDPAERLPSISEDRIPRYVPSWKEMARLLEIPDTTTDAGVRDRAILELLYGSGLRRHELIALETRDVNLEERTAFIRDGKGKKDRVVPITEKAAHWVATYLSRRPPHPSPRLFLDIKGERPLRGTSLLHHFRELFSRAGLQESMGFHSIRHACALHLLEGGADLVSIKKLLGHGSIETTAIYLKLTTTHLRRALRRAHPREKEVPDDESSED